MASNHYPEYNRIFNLFNLILNRSTFSSPLGDLCKGLTSLSMQLSLYTLSHQYGIRNAELTKALMEKTVALLEELFANPENLKPLSEWRDFEKHFILAMTIKMLAGQTHDIKILDRIKARIKDVSDFAREDREHLLILIGLTTAALFVATITIMVLIAAPVAAIPFALLLGLIIKGLHAFITLPHDHSNKLTEAQEVTDFCKALLNELSTYKEQLKTLEEQAKEYPKQAEEYEAVQQFTSQGTKQHGRFTLPLSFFKQLVPDSADGVAVSLNSCVL